MADESKRIDDPAGNLDDEDPRILDPFRDDPSDHIRFRKEVASPLTEKGKATIELCGLNRTENRSNPAIPLNDGLQESRREHYEVLEALYKALSGNTRGRIGQLLLDDVEWQRRWAVLESRVLGPRAPYLAMVRQAFLDDFDLVR